MTTTFQERIKRDEEELALLEKQLREQTQPEEPEKEDEQEEQKPDTVVDNSETEETPSGGTNWEKRYADLRSHTAKKEKEAKAELDALRAEIAELRSTTAIPASTDMPQNQKELAEWREKNPQAARILQALIEEEAEKKFESAKIDLEEIKKDRARLAREKAEAKIRSVHDDFDVLKDSDDFHDWIETRPKVIQDAVYKNNNDPESVIGVIDLYKAAKGIKKTTKQKETAADAVTVKGGKATVDPEAGKPQPIKESWVASLSMKDYEKNAEKIEEAIRSGNFIYDMSKKVIR